MIKIELLGELGSKFGSEYSMDVRSPAEAVRALCINLKDFRKYMEESSDHGVAYQVINCDEAITLDELHNPLSKTLKIVPVMMGAGGGGGLLQTIVGVALVVASFYIPGSIFFIEAALATGIGVGTMATAALTMGVALTLSGVTQMLSPTPALGSTGYTNNNTEQTPSYIYNGAVNTTAQGHPVPLGYGRLIIGSAVISAGTDTVDIQA